jgi:hypothetical protein
MYQTVKLKYLSFQYLIQPENTRGAGLSEPCLGSLRIDPEPCPSHAKKGYSKGTCSPGMDESPFQSPTKVKAAAFLVFIPVVLSAPY